jgi:hypothetical protein
LRKEGTVAPAASIVRPLARKTRRVVMSCMVWS